MFRCHWQQRLFTLLGGFVLLLSLPGRAWSQDQPLGSRVNGLLAFDFSDHYITPRGLHVEDNGLIGQPLLLLFWKVRSFNQGPVTDVTLNTGVWNSFHSHQAGLQPSRWAEIDPIFGLTIKFRRGFVVDASTTAFYTPTRSYATSGHADVKLTYNDPFRGGFALNPYIDFWRELNDKATVRFNPATSSRGSYLTLGAIPDAPPRHFRHDPDGRDQRQLRQLGLLPAVRWIRRRVRAGDRVHGAPDQRAAEVSRHRLRRLDRVRRRDLSSSAQRRIARRQSSAGHADRKTNLIQFRGGVSIFF